MAVIAIDFDHTIVEGKEPFPGVKRAINLMREAGHKIIIHSCNNPNWIEQVMNNNDLRYDGIWNEPGKPLADLYVDDKGFKFMGNWDTDIPLILELVKGMDNRKW